jgi:heat-inducible transcriptional repressor
MDEEKEHIVKEYKKEISRLEDVLENTSEVIAKITHYAGIVSFLEWQDKFFYKGISFILEQPEFRDLDKMRILIKMVEEKRRLLDIINRDFNGKVKVYIGEELDCPEMLGCSLVVSTYSHKNRPSGRIAVLGPMRMEYSHIIPTVEYISDVVSGLLENF